MTNEEKIEALSAQLKTRGLDGFIIPRADEYQGEFVAPYAERLQWLTGFSGSAGIAAVLTDRAVVMSDGRYTLQLEAQVDTALCETCDSTKISLARWLSSNIAQSAVIGFDPWLHTPEQVEAWKVALNAAGKDVTFKPLEENILDRIWTEQPERPQGAAVVFSDEIAGLTSLEKRALIARTLEESSVNAAILTLPDSIAWLLNIRGNDVANTPLLLSYLFIEAETARVTWFVDPERVSGGVCTHIGRDVEIVAPRKMEAFLKGLNKDRVVALDFARSPLWFKNVLEATAGLDVHDMKDPCIAPKSIKTTAEQEAIKKAHILDGAALVKFFCWLEGKALTGTVSELDVAARVLEFRQKHPDCAGESFPSIAGFGANAAIIHYRATLENHAILKAGGALLLDSGGQYKSGGTTDLTRTVFIGSPEDRPNSELCENYTRVLQGHIDLAMARFPEGTNGAQLDTLARTPLWQVGLDYAHGTGHGVGCYLGVHEEAAGISPRGQEALKAGMLISNEPGYYKVGAYGIRLESLMLVREAGHCADTGRDMLCFETVALVPFDRRLIQVELLSVEALAWLNAYQARVYELLFPHLLPQEQEWLRAQTAPL